MAKFRLLVLEDEANIARLISEVCRLRGNVETRTAITGEEAFALLNEEEFDYLLLDLSLPDISGTEFYLSAIEMAPRLKGHCLLMSGHLPQGEIESFIEEHHVTFLQKPFPLKSFLEILDALVAGQEIPESVR